MGPQQTTVSNEERYIALLTCESVDQKRAFLRYTSGQDSVPPPLSPFGPLLGILFRPARPSHLLLRACGAKKNASPDTPTPAVFYPRRAAP